jgi:hypothetical protein
MRTAWLWLGLFILLLLPVQATAQHQRGEPSRGLNGAVERLFEHREQLGMTTDQLVRLQQIKDEADTRKQPLWQQVMSVRRDLKARQRAQPDMPEAEKTALVERSGHEIERLLGQIRTIDHAAMREVGAVLTEQQKERVMEMVKQNRRDGNRSDSPRERGDGRD